jgi:hypothetical protein
MPDAARLVYIVVTPLIDSDPEARLLLKAQVTATGEYRFGDAANSDGTDVPQLIADAATDADVTL